MRCKKVSLRPIEPVCVVLFTAEGFPCAQLLRLIILACKKKFKMSKLYIMGVGGNVLHIYHKLMPYTKIM